MKKIRCKTYLIHINNWEAINDYIAYGGYSSVFVLVDNNTLQYCIPLFEEKINSAFQVIVIKSGEEHKTIDSCQYIWDKMIDLGADRHSLCINLGGGVIGDMGGFTAATFMRGMDFIQVPTTLLSQVDASVGGKLGIDYNNYKNLIGIILNPGGVFIFTDFLKTLPYRQLLSGFAEVIKHGLIKDASAFSRMTTLKSLTDIDWEELIYESVLIKKSVTEEDPYEKGLRKILNFGHTLGHAIESNALSSNTPLLHGEAIAIGMIMEAHLSYQKSYITFHDAETVKNKILILFGHHPSRIPTTEVLVQLMAKDKKNKAGIIKFSLLQQLGEGNFDQEVGPEEIQNAISFYKA
ncbi:MAG: 3-dehydroquinate synthase [Bacteroidota bacterium]